MDNYDFVEIIAMSGYAGYVWGAFAVVFISFITLYFTTQRRLKKALKKQTELRTNKKNHETRH